MLVMRITVTLDDDLMAALKERARLLDQPFKQVVNDLLRCGLALAAKEAEAAKEEGKAEQKEPPAETRKPFKVVPIAGGLRPEFEGVSLNKVYDRLLVEDFLRKRQRDEEALRKRSQ